LARLKPLLKSVLYTIKEPKGARIAEKETSSLAYIHVEAADS